MALISFISLGSEFINKILPFREFLFLMELLLNWWWIWLPWGLFFVVRYLWLKVLRDEYIRQIKWVLLEIKIPEEIKKTPKAMEQVLTGLHGVQSTPNFYEAWFGGEVQKWFSLEMVSLGGNIHYFIRTPESFRNLVEAQIYAQYPEVEINLVEQDYVDLVPKDLPRPDFNLWGTELILIKDDAYPIRTYHDFYVKEAESLVQQVDSLSALMEVFSSLKPQENIWIQTLIRPLGNQWVEEAEKIKNKLAGREAPRKKSSFWKEGLSSIFGEIINNISQLLGGGKVVVKQEEKGGAEGMPPIMGLTQGEKDTITAIERKISKIGFEVVIRILYLAPVEFFSKSNVSAILGCYKQFSIQGLNGFRPNSKITPNIDYWWQFKKIREYYRKKKLFRDYRNRTFPLISKYLNYLKPVFPFGSGTASKPFVLNIEELATIYHFPGREVAAPLMPRLEAKKAEPPVRLPIG